MQSQAPSPEISVILPCCKEAENLKLLLPLLHQILQGCAVSHEVIIVDGLLPEDDSQAVAAQYHAIYINQKKSGYGAAVKTGIAAAKGHYMLIMDADGSHNPSYIPFMLELRHACDIVIGSRYIADGCADMPTMELLLSRLLNLICRLLLGLRIRDMSISFRLYRAAFIKPLRLGARNFDINEEILYRIVQANPQARIKEIPIKWQHRIHGSSKRSYLAFILSYVKTVMRLRLTSHP